VCCGSDNAGSPQGLPRSPWGWGWTRWNPVSEAAVARDRKQDVEQVASLLHVPRVITWSPAVSLCGSLSPCICCASPCSSTINDARGHGGDGLVRSDANGKAAGHHFFSRLSRMLDPVTLPQGSPRAFPLCSAIRPSEDARKILPRSGRSF